MEKTAATDGNGVRARGAVSSLSRHRPGDLPDDVRRIIIVGAGGFGREVLEWARHAWPDGFDRVRGFLSATPEHESDGDRALPILADPAVFQPEPTDGLVLAIGIPEVRRRVAECLQARGGRFLTLVHPTAIVAASASVGEGSVLCPYAIVSDAAATGRCVLMNYHSSLGHDSSAGAFTVLSPYAALGGDAHVGEDVFLGIHAVVAPRKRIGGGTCVSANSAAMTDVAAASLVFGVPGRVSPRIDITTASPSGR